MARPYSANAAAASPARLAIALVGGLAAVARRRHLGVGVDLRDDVLAEQPDRLEGVLELRGTDAEHELVDAGLLPLAALLERIVRVAHDDATELTPHLRVLVRRLRPRLRPL